MCAVRLHIVRMLGRGRVHTLVIYDIPEDKIRNKIAETCKDAGLVRVQWSAFLGELSHNRREELELRLRKVLGRREGNIQLYPVCDKDIRLRRSIEYRKPKRAEE